MCAVSFKHVELLVLSLGILYVKKGWKAIRKISSVYDLNLIISIQVWILIKL